MNRRLSVIYRYALLLPFLGSPATAQHPPQKGDMEIGVFGGLSRGLDEYRGMGGVNVGHAWFSKLSMFFGEFSYLPSIGRSIAVAGVAGASCSGSIPFTEAHAGVHL